MRVTRLIVLLVTLLGAAASPAADYAFKLAYDHNLSTPSGRIRTGSVLLSYDAYAGEVYVIGYGLVRIFNRAGMEVFSFGEDTDVGSIRGVAALENGDLVVLVLRDGKTSLRRANFRGEITGRLDLTGLPERFRDFAANRLFYGDRKLYLVDEASMRLLVTTEAGAHVASYDLAEILGVADKRADYGVSGCGVDQSGRFLFTVASLFKVHVLSPDGKLRLFGRPGGAPGKFNLVAGVGADDEGRIYVADSLKSTVSVFDPEFNFLGEFGYRGSRPGNLVRPSDLVVGGGKVYVSQGASRGVSVFRIVPDPSQTTKTTAAGG